MAGFDTEDTIAAIASAPGPAVRGIVRVSGPAAVACLEGVFHSSNGKSLSQFGSTTAVSGTLEFDSTIPDASNDSPAKLSVAAELLLWPTEKSYTRQPTVEVHTIGSTPVLQRVLAQICDHGARLANPGEFTLRAFLSGRLDLTQAEAVLAVIDSSGDAQLQTALQQLAGGLAGPLGEIRNQLMSTLAELEAGLDFVEEDIEFISQEELVSQLVAIRKQLESIEVQIDRRDQLVDSVKVVLSGLPNAGKSSLFNSLANSDQAIVTEIEGTTTDFMSAKLEFDSARIELVDTAGFDLSAGEIMQQAQSLREGQQRQAHVQLFCIDCSRDLDPWEIERLRELSASPATSLVVLTKSDLDPNADEPGLAVKMQVLKAGFEGTIVTTSCLRSEGLGQLRNHVAVAVLDSDNADGSIVSSTVLRASESLKESIASVDHAVDAAQAQLGEEIVAAEIRQALEGLGSVVGTVYTDDILDLVFGRFCIGK
ncbi:MAG: tRNA modification GTPase [Mariniblastus sp.]